MASVSAGAGAALCTAFIALEILPFLDPQQLGADPSAQAPLLDSAVVELCEMLLPLAALGALFAAVAVIYHHLHRTPAGAGAGAANRRLWGPFAVLCISASTVHLFFLVQPQPAGVGGAQARALGLAAARVLPAAAAATFFLGMALIIVAHIRAGGEGGGGGGGFAADGQIQGRHVLFLTKAAYAAAAALAWLMVMAMALCVFGAGTTAI